jgi:hypothetical protein
MSPFEVVQLMQSAGVGVVGLDLSRTVVVLRSVGETAVIRFRCLSKRIEKIGGSNEGRMKRNPMTSTTIARVLIDDERGRHLRTALPVLLQTETLRNGAA